MSAFTFLTCIQQVNRLEITPDKRFLAAAGNPHIRLFDINSNSPQPVGLQIFLIYSFLLSVLILFCYMVFSSVVALTYEFVFILVPQVKEDVFDTFWQLRSFDSHTNNVMAVGFQCDGNWMYSGSEDGTVKIWDLRYCRYQSGRVTLFPTSHFSFKSTVSLNLLNE